MDFVSHPAWLLDSDKTPVIHIGPMSISGPLLPICISAFFIYNSILRFRARRNHQIDIRQLPPVPNRNDLQWPDLRHPDAIRIYFAKANLAFHGVITTGAIMHFGRSFLEPDVLCCAQAAALLLYAEFVKPEVRRSCLAAATGWTLFTFLDQLSSDVAIVGTWLVALLAIPLAWQMDGVRGDVELQQSASGLLLILMTANKVIFDSEAAAQQWAWQNSTRIGLCMTTLHTINGLMICIFNRNGEMRTRNPNWNLQETITSLKSISSTIFETSCLLTALLAPLAGGVLCTSYLSSCLPWSGIFFGKCASSPSLSPFSFAAGCLVHITMWMVGVSVGQNRDLRPTEKTAAVVLRGQLRLNAHVIGWACTLLTILWVGLGMLA